jgi:predicted secreted protein
MNTAVDIYRRRFWTLIRLGAIFIFPIEVVYAIVFTAAASGSANAISELVLVLTGQLATAACLKAVSDTYIGHPTSWRSSFDFVWHRVGQVVALAVIEVVIVGIGLLLIVVPGVYLLVVLLVATPALLLENLNPILAMQRSRELVRGMWFRTAGTYLLSSIFVFLVALVPSLLFIRVSAGTHVTNTHPLAGQIASVVTSMLTTPFMAAVVVLIYYDLRVRKEGLDLDALARGVAVDPTKIDRTLFDRPEEPPYPDESR